MGIGMGRNPNGAVSDIAEAYRPIGAVRPVLVSTLSCVAVLLVLRGTGALANWGFVALLIAVLMVAPGAAGALIARRERPEVVEIPLERAGVDAPFSEAHVSELRQNAPVERGLYA
jgi:hypothetical protein